MNKRPRDGEDGEPSSSNKKVITQGRDDNMLSISASFSFFDLNHDGVIDRDELMAYFKSDKLVGHIIDKLDKNRDGVISYNEFYGELTKIKDGEATLQKYLEKFPLVTDAIQVTPAVSQSRDLQLQGRSVPLTWASHIKDETIDRVFEAGPFNEWIENINQIDNADISRPELLVDKVHIQHIDMFGKRVGFLKFEVAARKWNEKMKQVAFVPGIVFMRGGAVGILCILIEAETGKEYSLITLQPRIPAGFADFPEIPAGMLDGEPNKQKFAGKAAKEMNEETLLEIKDTELYDLTNLAYGDRYKGMYPSAGGCDEFLKLYLYRRYMSKSVLDLLMKAHAGDTDSEVIKLKLVPLDDLWREAPDAKALSALYLYHKFQEMKIEHPITPLNPAQEQDLTQLLQPKLEHNEKRREERVHEEKQKEVEFEQQHQHQHQPQHKDQHQDQDNTSHNNTVVNDFQQEATPLIDKK